MTHEAARGVPVFVSVYPSDYKDQAMAGRGEASELKGASSSLPFTFQTGELVLVKWSDGMVYFAKIKKIDRRHGKCTVVFDDKSQDEAQFDQIHSGKSTNGDR